MTGKIRLFSVMICATLIMSCLCACSLNFSVVMDDGSKQPAANDAVADTATDTAAEATVGDADEKAPAEEEQAVLPELESHEFDLTEYDKDGEYKVFESYGNSFLLTEDSAKVYPELDAVLKGIDEYEREFYRQSIDDNKTEAEEFAAQMREYGDDYTYFRYSETFLESADDRAVSLLRIEYGYLGGAHPDYYYMSENIDTKTGEEIGLSDIITDDEKLRSILKEKLNKEYPDGNFFDLDESLAMFKTDADISKPDEFGYTFTMSPSGICIYFDPYDLNSYADGSQQISIGYEEIADILKPGFIYEDYESKEDQ